MAAGGAADAQARFGHSVKGLLTEKVTSCGTDVIALTKQVLKGSRSAELLGQAARNMVMQEDAILHSEDARSNSEERRAVVKPTGSAESLAEMKRSQRLAPRAAKCPFPSRPRGSDLWLDGAGCLLGYVQSLCFWARGALSPASIHVCAPERSPARQRLTETNLPETLLPPTIPVSAYFPCSVRCSAHTSTPGKKCVKSSCGF
ncbi:BLOC-1-related complex subunit 7 isoform X1 [Calonectris borealis]|uniref:BLOC-1-related complex subunit 7 isoform X1 n=1 Tax=Calonectris borealis TaxID=1323832 RepID=UPI003F4B5F68